MSIFESVFVWIRYQLGMLRHRPKLWWNSLYIRKDEFHSSLNYNIDVVISMNDIDRSRYIRDLCKRRQISHERDIKRTNEKSNVDK